MAKINNKINNYIFIKNEVKKFDYKVWHPFDQVCLCKLLIEEAKDKGYHYKYELNTDAWKPFYVKDNESIYKLTNFGKEFLDSVLLRQIECESGMKKGLCLSFKECFEVINKDYKERLNKDRFELLDMFDDLDNRLREDYKQIGEVHLQEFIINRRFKTLQYEVKRLKQKQDKEKQSSSIEK